jgi:hypothetical protein
MSITFADRPYRTQPWDSAAELAGFLSRCDAGSVFLQEDLPHPARLFSFTLYLAGNLGERFGLGVASAGETGIPQLLTKPEHGLVMVGVDRLVCGVDVESRSVSFRVDCEGPFRQFVEVADASVTLVFHAAGVIALAEDGWELWRNNVGRILDWACEDGTLFLRLQDAPTAKLDVRTGAPR